MKNIFICIGILFLIGIGCNIFSFVCEQDKHLYKTNEELADTAKWDSYGNCILTEGCCYKTDKWIKDGNVLYIDQSRPCSSDAWWFPFLLADVCGRASFSTAYNESILGLIINIFLGIFFGVFYSLFSSIWFLAIGVFVIVILFLR